MIEDIQSLAFG